MGITLKSDYALIFIYHLPNPTKYPTIFGS